VIASYHHKDLDKRLSDLEKAMEKDALEDKRNFEQLTLQDHRIASLEIERFSREASPTNCYDDEVEWRSPQVASGSPSHFVTGRMSPRQLYHRHSAQPQDDPPTNKRISTSGAKEFYQNQLKDSPVMNSGNVETFGRARLSRTSPTTSHLPRSQAPDSSVSHENENEKIHQLQQQVDRQHEWMQSTMARVAAIEAKFGAKNKTGDRRW
jgi:hypothetical protein